MDLLICDYGDIMKPDRRYQDKLQEQAGVFEDLRTLAGVFEIPVLTATQVNRVGAAKEYISGIDVAGTWEKIMIADGIIALSAIKVKKAKDHLRLTLAESRNNPRRTFTIATSYGMGTFFTELLKEEEEVECMMTLDEVYSLAMAFGLMATLELMGWL